MGLKRNISKLYKSLDGHSLLLYIFFLFGPLLTIQKNIFFQRYVESFCEEPKASFYYQIQEKPRGEFSFLLFINSSIYSGQVEELDCYIELIRIQTNNVSSNRQQALSKPTVSTNGQTDGQNYLLRSLCAHNSPVSV